MAARSAHLGLVLVVVSLLSSLVSAAGNEAGAMVPGIPTRHLLQTVQPCPVDFATQNYSVVTNVCKVAKPDMDVCCKAFVEFACPFAEYINDANTNCNSVMFTYLNLAGTYPEQFFQSCQGNELGLSCLLAPDSSPNANSSSSNPNSANRDMMPSWRLPSLVILLVTLAHLVR